MKKIFFISVSILLLSSLSCSKKDSGAQAPAAPSNLKITVFDAVNYEVRWVDNSTNEIGFKIEIKAGSEDYHFWHEQVSGSTSWADGSLTHGVTYSFRVRAYNAVGYSDYSNEATFTR